MTMDIKTTKNKYTELRKHAEQVLKNRPDFKHISEKIPEEQILNHIQELRLYQVELEIQNEELCKALVELEKLRDKYSDLYDFAPVGYFTISNKGLILAANLTAASLLGIERRRLIGKRFSSFISKDTQSTYYKHLNKLIETRILQIFELKIVKTSGSEFYAQLECLTGQDSSGHFNQFRMTMSNISKRKETENALLESEKKFSSAFQSSLALMTISTLENDCYIEVNNEFLHTLGYERDEVIGKSSRELLLFPDYEKQKEITQTLKKKGHIRNFEAAFRSKNGNLRQGLFSIDIIRLQEQQCRLTVIVDITKKKQLEAEQLELETRLQQIQKYESLQVMAGGIAHHFNNLLMGIMGSLELVMRDLPPSSPQKKNIKNANSAATRAVELSRLMLTYVGQYKGNVQSIDMTKIVEGMTSIFEASFSKQAELKFYPASEPIFFKANSTEIHHLLISLVTNGIEAIEDSKKITGSKPRKGIIKLTTGKMFCRQSYFQQPFDKNLPEGEYVFVEIADNGCGMDRETLTKIFDPFFTTKFTGRGLGLSYVLGIVCTHKGTVKVKSKPGKGTKVKILFPECQPPAESKIEVQKQTDKWRGTGTVLLADDEELVQEVGKEMLQELGFRVIIAADGIEAIEIFQEQFDKIDCVLLDIIMPHKGGKETFYQLRSIRKDIPVIFCSGFPKEQVSQQFDNTLPAEFIEKPFQLAKLAKTIKKVLLKRKNND